MKNHSIYLLLLCLAAACSSPEQQTTTETEDPRMNFVLIYTDELEFDDVGAYGGKFPTPHIDRLAEEGMQFMQARTTASMCTPSRFSLMTGQMPTRCRFPGFLENCPDSVPCSIAWNTWIDDAAAALPLLLQAEGYFTGMAGKWHIGKLPDGTSLPRFQADDNPEDPAVQQKLRQHQQTVAGYLKQSAGFDMANSVLRGNFDGFPVKALAFHNIPWITRGGISFLDTAQQRQQPFFLYLAPTAIHGPNHFNNLTEDLRHTIAGYQPEVARFQPDSAALIEKAKTSCSQAEAHRFAGIAHIDHQVGQVISYLEEAGLYEKTAIIFMADHNIEPGKATCYEKGTHVPLIIRWPGARKQGRQSSLVQNTDLLPTLLQAAGADSLPRPLDGHSLLPLLNGETEQVRQYAYSEAGYTRSITDGRYKFIALRYPETVMQKIMNGGMLQAPNHLNTPRQAHSRIAIKYFPNYFEPEQFYDLQSDPGSSETWWPTPLTLKKWRR